MTPFAEATRLDPTAQDIGEQPLTPRTRTRRKSRRGTREPSAIKQLPWHQPRNPFPPIEILSTDHVETIHQASLEILRDLGLEFMSNAALDVLEREGAEVNRDTQIVKFDPDLVEEVVAKAPREFEMFSRNRDRNLLFGGTNVIFTLVSSPPNVSDLDRGRRPGTYEDQCNLIRLLHSLNTVHMAGITPVEALDLQVNSRHLDLCHAYLTLSDRIFSARAIGRERIIDAIDMACIASGVDRDGLKANPAVYTNINVNSPRRVDNELLTGMMEMMLYRQPVAITPFTLAGAMSPVTLAGSLTQQNAEALGVLAFAQMFAPGTPVVYGGFTSNVDMKSGAPAFGTPEYVKGTIASGQLARRYGLPYRSSNVNAANSVDAQAAYESQMSVWATIMGGANLVWHGAGWMEGGLTSSFEKVIIDADNLQMMAEVMKPIQVDESTLGLEAIEDVGIGGHFFGTAHTIERYENAFYEPMVSDWRNFESWEEAGSPSAAQHANRIWKKLLREYEPPPMAADRREELDEFVTRRKLEIGEQKW